MSKRSGRGGQFRPLRMVGLAIAFSAMFSWVLYMRANFPPRRADGSPPPVPAPGAWDPFVVPAVLAVVFVITVDLTVIILTRRMRRRLPEVEKDWHGPDPHLDRRIAVEDYRPSPLMRRAIRRSLARQAAAEP